MLHLDTRAVRHAQDDSSTTHQREPEAIRRLRPLLAASGELDPQDREGWIRLRHAARLTTVAWRHATSAPSRQERS